MLLLRRPLAGGCFRRIFRRRGTRGPGNTLTRVDAGVWGRADSTLWRYSVNAGVLTLADLDDGSFQEAHRVSIRTEEQWTVLRLTWVPHPLDADAKITTTEWRKLDDQ